MNQRTILVLGASGLIGRFVTDDLRARGFRVVGVARSLSPAQTMSALIAFSSEVDPGSREENASRKRV